MGAVNDSAPTPLVVENWTSRRFPRSLSEAFPVSENRRAAIELPDNRLTDRIIDAVCLILGFALLLFCAWIGLSLPKPW